MNNWDEKTRDGQQAYGWGTNEPRSTPPQNVNRVDSEAPFSFENWANVNTPAATVQNEPSPKSGRAIQTAQPTLVQREPGPKSDRSIQAAQHPWGNELPPAVEADLEQRVVQKFKNSVAVDDIIFSICQETGWNWAHAKQFVVKTYSKRGSDISRTRSRIMLVFGFLFLLLGMGLILYNVLELSFFGISRTTRNSFGGILLGFFLCAGSIIGIIYEFWKQKQ